MEIGPDSSNQDWQAYVKAFDSCLRLLAKRARSTREITDYLSRKQVSGLIIDEVLHRLKDLGYLDDLSFAREFVESREKFRPRSRLSLRYELRQRGIDDAIIRQALDGVDETVSALNALAMKWHSWERLEEEKRLKKSMSYLKNRGFSFEVSRSAIKAVMDLRP